MVRSPSFRGKSSKRESLLLKKFKSGFTKWPDANIGIVTGKTSGIAVVDFDSPEAFAEATRKGLPSSPVVKTSRGVHHYCQYAEGVRNFQKRGDLPGIDLRCDGGYVVAPPSIHSDGTRYEWLKGSALGEVDFPTLPEWLLAKNNDEKILLKQLYAGVAVGDRNNSLSRLAGSWVKDGLSLEECLENAKIVNARNNPPLPYEETVQVVKSIYEIHYRKNRSGAEPAKFDSIPIGNIKEPRIQWLIKENSS